MKSVLRSFVTAVLIAGAVLCFTIGVLASSLPRVVGRPAIQETRSLRLPKATLARLKNEDGSVQVRTHSLDEIHLDATIKAYVRGSGDIEQARAYVASLVQTSEDGNTLEVVTEPRDRPESIELLVDYEVLVPVGTDISIEAANGNVRVAKGCGQVWVQGRNTDIEISEPGGSVAAESTNGRIRITDAQDDALLKTINGNVYARMLGGSLSASTTNGAIVAWVLDPKVALCDLSSQNGGITLVMPEECSALVDAVTARGVIASDFPVEAATTGPPRRRLHGTIGAGHTKVRMDTLNGNVWIAKGTM